MASEPPTECTAPVPGGAVAAPRGRLGPSLITGLLLGIGIAGFIDEALFHQLLQWHNFYWNTSPHGRIVSDGLFHIGSTLVLLWGTLRLWQHRADHGATRSRAVLAGILLGAGGFNAYDGIVQHMILHFHLVNERVCPSPMNGTNSIATCPGDIPYEIVWIAVAAAIAGAGLTVWRRARDA
jgi:uncharacterized membrane protein